MIEKRHKRVSFFLENLAGGGAEKNMIRMANYLADSEYQVEIVLTKAEGQLIQTVSPAVKIVDFGSNNMYVSLPKLVKYLNYVQPGTLISTLDLANLIAIIASKLSKEKPKTIIRIASTTSIQYRPWHKKILEKMLLGLLYPGADVIIAVSDGVADDLARYIHVSRERILRLFSPVITTEILRKAKEAVDHPWFQTGEPPVIVSVGRLNHAKNFPRLLRVFARIRKEREARLVIFGEGELGPYLEYLIIEYGLEEFVQLPGFVHNPYSYLAKAGVFVLSSNYEGLPTALIEAMACGCPVVATDCPSGPREILAGGKYGELVPIGDDESLVQAILRVLDGQNQPVPEEWLKQFHIDSFFQKFMEII